MVSILAHAQGLVYTLLSLMPSQYQRDNLEAMLGLFLQAQGHPLPQHTKAKSASAIRALFKHLLLVNPKANSRNKADSNETNLVYDF